MLGPVDPKETARVVREFRLMLRNYFDLAREDWLSVRQLAAYYRSLQEKGLSGSSIHQHL